MRNEIVSKYVNMIIRVFPTDDVFEKEMLEADSEWECLVACLRLLERRGIVHVRKRSLARYIEG